jgi:serine/threonine protein kinase/WD40 repeat protein/Tfp pilus assembly protein PilF
MTDAESGPDLLNELAHQFAERYRKGERPALTEYTDRYPELAEQIRDLFPALVVMEEFGSVAGQPPADSHDRTGPDGRTVPRQLGEYRILREVGRGGMGIVYEAVQESLGRHVALKVLPLHGLISNTHLERFEREAKAVARLHHTNIVPVFGSGSHAGVHYYAMQFIQGQGLDAVLKEVRRLRGASAPAGGLPVTVTLARGLLTGRLDAPEGLAASAPTVAATAPPFAGPHVAPARPALGTHHLSDLTGPSEAQYFRGVARLGVQVADALAYAHRQGIVHRDVKPSNLLLDTQGVVWVTDFGLVKEEEGGNLTQTGDIVGTVRYMAPERFDGHGDARSDIYSLGATLYELLTLRPAFEDAHRARLVERVLRQEPVPPRKLDAKVPRDLETIVLKAMTKDPAGRYPTAGDLAEDLRRFLADRPVRARRSSAAERTWRWCRRNPVVASLLTAVATLLVVIAVGSSLMAWRLNREHQDAVANWQHAQQAERAVKEELVQSRLTQARSGRSGRQAGRGFDGLKALAEAAQLAHQLNFPEDRLRALRDEAIACMAVTDLRPARRLDDLAREDVTTGFDPQVAFDSRWEVYARGDPDGNVCVRRLEDEQELARFSQPGNVAPILLFSPDGRYLAAKFYRNHSERPVEYLVWDWREGKQVVRQACEVLTRPMPDFAFTRDSRQVILGDRRDGSLGFYDLASGREVRRLDLRGVSPWFVAPHPDGKRLAVLQDDNVTVRNLDTGAVLSSWKPGGSIWGLAWHPDGNLLAVAGNRRIYLWDAVAGQQRRVLEGHEGQVIHLTFNHAGTLLASWGWDNTTRLWDPHGGGELVTTHGHCVEFSPDDRSLAYRTADEVGTWEVAHERVCRTVYASGGGVRRLRFSGDGRLLVAACGGGVRLWDAAAARPVADLPVGSTFDVLLAAADGSLITSGPRGLYRWPLRAVDAPCERRLVLGPAQRLPVTINDRPWQGSLDLKGQRLAVADFWQKAVVIDLNDRAAPGPGPDPGGPWLLTGHVRVSNVALSPDGRWAATGTFKGADIKVWSLSGDHHPQPVHTIPCGAAEVAFSPDGRWLVVGDENRFYKVGSWEPAEVIRGKRANGSIAFADDAPVMAVPYDDRRQVGLLDPETGRELAVLAADNAQMIDRMALSADGGRLAVARSDNTVQLWDLRAVRRRLADLGLDWDPSPDRPEETGPDTQPLTLAVEGPIPAAAPKPPAPDPAEPLRARLALYSLAITLTPYHPEPYHQRGHAYARLGQPRQAVADFTAALAWEGPDRLKQRSHLHAARAASLRSLKEYDRAIGDLRRAVDLDPENLDACNSLAWLYVAGPPNLRDPRQALPLAKRAVAGRPGHGNSLNTLGVVYYRLDEPERAVVALERSLRELKDESLANNCFFLAMCHWRLGDPAQARDCYDRAVRWTEAQRKKLSPARREELDAIRAEAEALIAKPK